MKEKIRSFFWKFLGSRYYDFLKGQKNKSYLHQAKHLKMGIKSYHNGAYVWQWDLESSIEIGSYCSIANDVNFIVDDGYHLLSDITSFPHFAHMSDPKMLIGNLTNEAFRKKIKATKSNIIVGNDVWIGMNVIILPGVKIGNGVTIMAGAVVSSDVSDYTIVGGVPAKVVKMKYDNDTIKKLNAIAWWDWDVKRIEENAADFYLTVNDFVKKWECT